MDIVPRHLTARVVSAPRTTRVINIVGPRQTGKRLRSAAWSRRRGFEISTTSLLDSWRWTSAVSFGTLLAETQKPGLPIVIDEVQRLPQITLAL